MNKLAHKTLSVGGVIKKIAALNPDLGVREISNIIRQSIETQELRPGDFAPLDVIDEEKALALARATLRNPK